METQRDQPRRRIAREPGAAEAREFAARGPWRLVAEASVDTRIAPGLRRLLDRGLAGRAEGLTLGERISLARIAGPETRRVLADQGPRPVLEAMLSHPRLARAERERILARLRGPRHDGSSLPRAAEADR